MTKADADGLRLLPNRALPFASALLRLQRPAFLISGVRFERADVFLRPRARDLERRTQLESRGS